MRLGSTDEFLDALKIFVDKESKPKKDNQQITTTSSIDSPFKLGRVDPNYSSGRPRIIFEGESVVSGKAYPYLSSYTPVANDVVLLVRMSNSYIILGKRV